MRLGHAFSGLKAEQKDLNATGYGLIIPLLIHKNKNYGAAVGCSTNMCVEKRSCEVYYLSLKLTDIFLLGKKCITEYL